MYYNSVIYDYVLPLYLSVYLWCMRTMKRYLMIFPFIPTTHELPTMLFCLVDISQVIRHLWKTALSVWHKQAFGTNNAKYGRQLVEVEVLNNWTLFWYRRITIMSSPYRSQYLELCGGVYVVTMVPVWASLLQYTTTTINISTWTKWPPFRRQYLNVISWTKS